MAEKVDYAALKKGGFMRQKQKGCFSLRLAVVGGNLTAENIKTVAEVAEKYGHGYVHMTSRQGIEIPFIKVEDINEVKEELAKGGVGTGVCGPRVRTITACQGAAICPSGCIDTYTLAKELDARYFGRELPHKFKFIYSILYKPCIFKAYRLLNVQTLCIFPCFCPYEPKQGKFLFSADYLIQQSCGSTLRFPCSVSVNVHCGTDISVSEKFLHIFRCCTV